MKVLFIIGCAILVAQSTHAQLTTVVTGTNDVPVSVENIQIDPTTSEVSMDIVTPRFDWTWAGSEEFTQYAEFFNTIQGETGQGQTVETILEAGEDPGQVEGVYFDDSSLCAGAGSHSMRAVLFMSRYSATIAMIENDQNTYAFCSNGDLASLLNDNSKSLSVTVASFTDLRWDNQGTTSVLTGSILRSINTFKLSDGTAVPYTGRASAIASSAAFQMTSGCSFGGANLVDQAEMHLIKRACWEQAGVTDNDWDGIKLENIFNSFVPGANTVTYLGGDSLDYLITLAADATYVPGFQSGMGAANAGVARHVYSVYDTWFYVRLESDTTPLFQGHTSFDSSPFYMEAPKCITRASYSLQVETSVCSSNVLMQIKAFDNVDCTGLSETLLMDLPIFGVATYPVTPNLDLNTGPGVNSIATRTQQFAVTGATYEIHKESPSSAPYFNEAAIDNILNDASPDSIHITARAVSSPSDSYLRREFDVYFTYGGTPPAGFFNGTTTFFDAPFVGSTIGSIEFDVGIRHAEHVEAGDTSSFCPVVVKTTTPEQADVYIVAPENYPQPSAVLSTDEFTIYPTILPIIDFVPSSTGPASTPRGDQHIGSCASVKPTHVVDYDVHLRQHINNLTAWPLQPTHVSEPYFTSPGSNAGFPSDFEDDEILYYPFQSPSIFEGVTTSNDLLGRHMLTYHLKANLVDLVACQMVTDVSGTLAPAVTITTVPSVVSGEDYDITNYHFNLAYIGVLPKKLNGLRGDHIEIVTPFNIAVFQGSRTTQVIHSGRDLFPGVVSINGRQGVVGGCLAGHGRLEFDIELAFAKESLDNNDEILGIASSLTIGPPSPGITDYPNCYNFPSTAGSAPSLDVWSSSHGSDLPDNIPQTTCNTHTDPTCQQNGAPWCPENVGMCFQRLLLSTACHPLTNSGDTFTSDNSCPAGPSTGGVDTTPLGEYTGAFFFSFQTRVCENRAAWDAQDPFYCVDATHKDTVRIYSEENFVYPEEEDLGEKTIDLKMQVLRFTGDSDFDNDGLSPFTDFSDPDTDIMHNTANPNYSQRSIARYTEPEFIPIVIKPVSDVSLYPLAFTDLVICRGPTVQLVNHARKVQNRTLASDSDFCVSLSNSAKITIMENGVILHNCGPNNNEACIDSANMPKNANDVLSDPQLLSTFAVCANNIACDALAVRASHIIDALGYTGELESYIIEGRASIGEVQVPLRHLLSFETEEDNEQEEEGRTDELASSYSKMMSAIDKVEGHQRTAKAGIQRLTELREQISSAAANPTGRNLLQVNGGSSYWYGSAVNVFNIVGGLDDEGSNDGSEVNAYQTALDACSEWDGPYGSGDGDDDDDDDAHDVGSGHYVWTAFHLEAERDLQEQTDDANRSKDSWKNAMIAFIVILGVSFLVLLITIVYYCRQRYFGGDDRPSRSTRSIYSQVRT